MSKKALALTLALCMLMPSLPVMAGTRDTWHWVTYYAPEIQHLAGNGETLYFLTENRIKNGEKFSSAWYLYELTGEEVRRRDLTAVLAPPSKVPPPVVNALVPDGEFLWLATSAGAYLLKNGEVILHYSLESLGMASDIHAVFRDVDESLWFGGVGGVARLERDGNWTVYDSDNSPFPEGVPVVDICRDGQGSLWLACGSGRLSSGGFATKDVNCSTAVLKLRADGTWLVYTLDPYTVTPRGGSVYPTPLGFLESTDGMYVHLYGSSQTVLLQEKAGKLVELEDKGTQDTVIVRGADGSRTSIAKSSCPEANFWNAVVDRDCTYLARGPVLYGISQGTRKVVLTASWYPFERAKRVLGADLEVVQGVPEVNAVRQDSRGGYYVASGISGVLHFVDGKVTKTYDTSNSRLPDNNVVDVEVLSDGSTWMATQFGVLIVRPDGREELLHEIAPCMPREIRDISVAPDGTVWITTYWDQGVYHLTSEGIVLESYETDGSPYLICGSTAAVYPDEPGTLWVASNFGDGVSRLVPGMTMHYLAHWDGVGETRFDKVLLRDVDDTLWLFSTQARRNLYSLAMDYSVSVLRPSVLVDVDGVPLKSDAFAYMHEGEAKLPLRAIAECLAYHIGWDQSARRITLKCGSKELSLEVDTGRMRVDGHEEDLGWIPDILDGRTFVTMQFVERYLGAKVEWYPELGLVNIMK